MMNEKRLFGLCHPLIDIQAAVDNAFLDKYGLEPDNTILADKRHLSLYQELIEKMPVKFIPGGCTLNTLRVCQWMMGENGSTFFSGAVGNDALADILIQKVRDSGIDAIWQTSEDHQTGTCASLINGSQGYRSLVTKLGAAKHYQRSHLDREDMWEQVKKSTIFYFSGYFLTTQEGVDSMMAVAKYSAQTDKQFFAFNLSANYICEAFTAEVDQILPFADFIIGNEHEAKAYAKCAGFKCDSIEEIAMRLAQLPKVNKAKKRHVIITQGAKPTIVVDDNGNIALFEVKRVKKITDTNGAGDAFVGGFFAGYLQGASIADSVKSGQWAARIVIQNEGCTFPKICEYDYDSS